jgi:hypothetical protein
MKRQFWTVAVVGLLASAAIGADLKTGLVPGDKVTAFNPLNVTGSAAGDKACQV